MKGLTKAAVYLFLLFDVRIAIELVNDHFTQYLLLVSLVLLAVIGAVWGVSRLFRAVSTAEEEETHLSRLMPPCLILLGLLLLYCVPFTQIFAEIKHDRYGEERNKVVTAIEQVQWIPDRFGKVKLPETLERVSLDGEVMVYELNPERSVIGFYVFRGMPDGASATVYSSDDRTPDEEVLDAETIFLCKRLEKNWYYVSYD